MPSGIIEFGGGGIDGITVDAWNASRFPTPPVFDSPTPTGSPDAQTISGSVPGYGQHGAWVLTLPTNDTYYVRAFYQGANYWWPLTPSSGGGNFVPIADQVDITAGTISYGGETLHDLEGNSDWVMTFRNHGDVFPQWLFSTDGFDGIYFGDGTFDPFSGTNLFGNKNTDGSWSTNIVSSGGTATDPNNNAPVLTIQCGNIPNIIKVPFFFGGEMAIGGTPPQILAYAPISIQTPTGTPVTLWCMAVNPNLAYFNASNVQISAPGNVGDLAINQLGTWANNNYLWACTTAGGPGVAVWTPLKNGGGYASLTGTGQTASPGDLSQNGAFSAICPSGDPNGIYLQDSDGRGGVSLVCTAGSIGTSITDTTSGGVQIYERGGGGIGLTNQGAGKIGFFDQSSANTSGIYLDTKSSVGIVLSTPANTIALFTADVRANLATPHKPPALGFTQDGHIYFYAAPSGPWTLLAPNAAPRVTSIASSATPAINTDTTDVFEITALAVNITSMTTNLTGTFHDGQRLLVRIKDNGTSRNITWGSSFIASGITTLMTATPTGKQSTSEFIYDANAGAWVLMAVDATGY